MCCVSVAVVSATASKAPPPKGAGAVHALNTSRRLLHSSQRRLLQQNRHKASFRYAAKFGRYWGHSGHPSRIASINDPRQHARQRRAHAGRVGPPSMRSRPRVAAHLVSLVHGAVYNELVWRPRRQKNTFRSRPYGRPTREAIARQRPVGGTNYSGQNNSSSQSIWFAAILFTSTTNVIPLGTN